MHGHDIINQLLTRDTIKINVLDLAGEGEDSADFLVVSRVILVKRDQ